MEKKAEKDQILETLLTPQHLRLNDITLLTVYEQGGFEDPE